MDISKEGSIKEIQGTKLSIHRNGKLIICCGPYSTLLLNTNDNKIRVKSNIGKKSKEITVCQWSKHGDSIVIGLNNVLKVFDSDMTKLQSLKSHYDLSINSVDWHPGNRHQLISTSNGNKGAVCLWDIRGISGPSMTIDISTVQQAKWHRFNSNIFAITSGSDICVWDQRSIVEPIYTVPAHDTIVSDFDWLPRDDNSVVSCGQFDGRLKLWNFSIDDHSPKFEVDENTRMAHCILNQTGDLLMTLTAPDTLGDNQLTLWDTTSSYDAQKLNSSSFISNHVTAFEWIELSWDKQKIFSLYKNYDYKILDVDKTVGIVKKRKKAPADASSKNDRFYLSTSPLFGSGLSSNMPTVLSETFSSSTNTPVGMVPRYSDSNLITKTRTTKSTSSDIDTKIQKEFDRLTNNMQITYEKSLRERKVIAHISMVTAKCSILFAYRDAGPENVFLEATLLSEMSERIRKQNLEELDRILKSSASLKSCGISKCVDLATDYINKLSARVNIRTIRGTKDTNISNNSFRNLPDVKVPYPRSCGAKFSPSGYLVCFLAPAGQPTKFLTTPRSFMEVAKHNNATSSGKDLFYSFTNVTNNMIPQRTFKPGSKKNKMIDINGDMDFPSRMHSMATPQKQVHNVYIYNAQRLSLFCPILAKNYSYDVSKVESLCAMNLEVVADCNRNDLHEFWQYCVILANASRPTANDFNNQIKPWPSQLLGRQMCTLWLDHFLKILDIQSAAMLILVMMSIDAQFDADFEARYNYTYIIGNSKTISPESIQENQCADNSSTTSLTSCVNFIFDGVKVYKVYDDKTNCALIISDGSYDGQNKQYNNIEPEHQCGMKKSDKQVEMIFKHRENCRLIDQSKLITYGLILLQYSRLLAAQNLLTAATKVTRKVLPVSFFNNICNLDQFTIRFVPTASKAQFPQHVGHLTTFPECPAGYRDPAARFQTVLCSICRLSVHGLLSLCSQCNHGGHFHHLVSWFSRDSARGYCATGCGCQCAGTPEGLHEMPSPPLAV